MDIDEKSQELMKRRLEEDQQRAREAKQSVRDHEKEEQQTAREANERACEIEDMKQQCPCEVQDTEQRCTIEDMDMVAYTKNIKIKQMRECVHVDACMMQENDYQERCRDEIDVTHQHQEQIHDLYEKEGKSPPYLDNKMFSVLESILKYHLVVLPKSSWSS